MSAAHDIRIVPPPSSERGSRYRPEQVIGARYRLVRPLAKGGMAELWIAEHAELHNEVVLKFLKELDHADDGTMRLAEERFKLEAQLSAQLSQKTKHIVHVFDWGSNLGVPWLAMEYVKGHTLERELQKGPLPLERFVAVFEQVLDALEIAHKEGIIHRDLKPSNVMIGDDGSGGLLVKLADFGVAKAQRTSLLIQRPAETRSNIIVGSPAYASPEQLFGNDVDVRTDLWSLGVLAYEALTGKRPFAPSSDEVSLATLIVNITMKPFKMPSRVARGLPGTIDAWFMRALAKKAQDRFQSIAEMRAGLAEALAPRARRAALIRGGIVAACVLSPLIVTISFLASRAHGDTQPSIVMTPTAAPLPPPQVAAAATAPPPEATPSQSPPTSVVVHTGDGDVPTSTPAAEPAKTTPPTRVRPSTPLIRNPPFGNPSSPRHRQDPNDVQ